MKFFQFLLLVAIALLSMNMLGKYMLCYLIFQKFESNELKLLFYF